MLHFLERILDLVLFIVWLSLEQEFFLFVYARNFTDVLPSKLAATLLDCEILFILLLLHSRLKVYKARPEYHFEACPYFVFCDTYLSLCVEELVQRLCHRIAFKLISDFVVVVIGVNLIFSVVERLRKDPVEDLVDKLHHLDVLGLE